MAFGFKGYNQHTNKLGGTIKSDIPMTPNTKKVQ